MKTDLDFLILARECEMAELQQLTRTSTLVQHTARLVHELQRERGLSNLYLASGGERFGAALQEQIQWSQEAEQQLREVLQATESGSTRLGHGARLYERMAHVVNGLNALPMMRRQVKLLNWKFPQSLEAYIRVVSSLLYVVFEAADGANDVQIAHRLVALFNFMQGKEYAGQERATGAALYAGGLSQAPAKEMLMQLIAAQERCLDVFSEFASTASRQAWQDLRHNRANAELERMRRVLCTVADGAPLDPELSETWFTCCSHRMGEMKDMEDDLAAELLLSCEVRMTQIQSELNALNTQMEAMSEQSGNYFSAATIAPINVTSPYMNSALERSVQELLQQQARRLQEVGEELEEMRSSMQDRKLIERAKGLLMAHRQLSEEDAHKTMRSMAMNQKRRLVDVADAVLTSAAVLPSNSLH